MKKSKAAGSSSPGAVIVSGEARFTFLTPALVRMEWSRDASFEDRASKAFISRRLPAPDVRVTRRGGMLTMRTAELEVSYREGAGRFDRDNLSIELTRGPRQARWRPGVPDRGNLRGTTRTLDRVLGSCELEPGLLSRDGWTLVDDSRNLVFDDRAREPWLTAREDTDVLDWYFFGYGRDYTRALGDFTRVAGRIPLPPKYAFGAWWSRYWPYSDRELEDLVTQFREHDVPLDVLVIDMDWHLPGWTGYTWNPKYFPEPEKFLSWVRKQNLRVTLNLHPATGVKKHEAAFAQVARAMGLDPRRTDHVPFDCSSRRYMDAYFKYLHHPLEKQGIDFWWMDWQQGSTSGVEGLDPLWWLNHLHWRDMQTNPARRRLRPLVFSRWGGLGNHRYPIGFSGDAYSTWSSLAFQPYMTSTAGNVGYGYWSHDIGGHLPGECDPELYVRWIQWGALSPILRTHTTMNAKSERRIWAFAPEIFEAARKAFHMRYALIPYIYTSARQCYDTGLPICRPLYYEWPDADESYTRTDEYMFGDQLLCAPVAVPAHPTSKCAVVDVWLPPGEWTNWFTGRTYKGETNVTLQVPLDEVPLFARAGAVIPMMPKMRSTSERTPDPMIIEIFPGTEGRAEIYEDDGTSPDYEKGQCARTWVEHHNVGGVRRVTIQPARGKYRGMPRRRSYEVRIREAWPPERVMWDGRDMPMIAETGTGGWRYDTATLGIVVRIPATDVRRKTIISAVPYAASRDDSALRGGLRGQLAILDEVFALLGPAAPANLRDATRLRNDIIRNPAAAAQIGEQIRLCWSDMVHAVGACRATSEKKDRALARMLGFSTRIHATRKTNRADRIDVTVDALVSPPVEVPAGLRARVDFDVPVGWTFVSGATRGKRRASLMSSIAPGQHLSVTRTFASKGAPGTAILRTRTALTDGTMTVSMPAEFTVMPSINTWWVVGPFDDPDGMKLAKIFGPEKEKRLLLASRYPGGKDDARVRWQPVARPISADIDITAEFFVDFHKIFGKVHENAAAYARTTLYSPRAMDAVLAVGSDDGEVIWWNGREVFRNPAGRPYVSKEDRISVRLKKGNNELLLKIGQGAGDWGFCVHLESPDGKPLPEVIVKR